MLYKLCQKCQGYKSSAQQLVLREAVLSQKAWTKPNICLAESNGKQLQEQWTREKWLIHTSSVSDEEMKEMGLQVDVEE